MSLETLLKFRYIFSNFTNYELILIVLMLLISFTIIFITNFRCFSSLSQKARNTNNLKRTLPKNMVLSHCPPNCFNPQLDQSIIVPPQRPLTIIFSWMLAKDKHLDKFRQLWFNKGFDVLTVRTSVMDPLLPPIGSQVVARNLVEVLSDLNTQYNEIVIHAFSVGGYQFGEVLVQLMADHKYSNILNSFKGFIMDSLVFANDRTSGLSRTLTSNPILQPIIEKTTLLIFKLFHNFIVKHYNNSEELVVNPPIKYAGLIFYSKNDLMSSFESNENLVESWIKLGNKISRKYWDQSTHVLHYRDHRQEYEEELDHFIKSLNLGIYRIA